MENLAVNIQELYEVIKERAEGEGAYSQEEWDDLVDEVLEEKREWQEVDDDADWVEIREALQARYEEFSSEIPEM